MRLLLPRSASAMLCRCSTRCCTCVSSPWGTKGCCDFFDVMTCVLLSFLRARVCGLRLLSTTIVSRGARAVLNLQNKQRQSYAVKIRRQAAPCEEKGKHG